MSEYKNQFVSYNIAKELYNKGFNEPCLGNYGCENAWMIDIAEGSFNLVEHTNSPNREYTVSAQTWEQARVWIEEKHNLFITVIPMLVSAGTTSGHRFTFFILNLNDYNETSDESPLGFLTYNEAREKAFLTAIELCVKK